MKTIYKGCEIDVTREQCLSGYKMLFYSVFDNGFEVTSGFSESNDTVRDYIKWLKTVVDDYKENPEKYLD